MIETVENGISIGAFVRKHHLEFGGLLACLCSCTSLLYGWSMEFGGLSLCMRSCMSLFYACSMEFIVSSKELG
jgi:hypothetical protein